LRTVSRKFSTFVGGIDDLARFNASTLEAF
jgi:hypothetical protein